MRPGAGLIGTAAGIRGVGGPGALGRRPAVGADVIRAAGGRNRAAAGRLRRIAETPFRIAADYQVGIFIIIPNGETEPVPD